MVLAKHPLCEACAMRGRVVAATDIDHINNNGDDNREANLMALCHSCHSYKTATEFHHNTPYLYGFGVDGLPITAEDILKNREQLEPCETQPQP